SWQVSTGRNSPTNIRPGPQGRHNDVESWHACRRRPRRYTGVARKIWIEILPPTASLPYPRVYSNACAFRDDAGDSLAVRASRRRVGSAEGAIRQSRPGSGGLQRPLRPLGPTRCQLDRWRRSLLVYRDRFPVASTGHPPFRSGHGQGYTALQCRRSHLSRYQRTIRVRLLPVGEGLEASGLPDRVQAPVSPLGYVELLRVHARPPITTARGAQRAHRRAISGWRDARL